MSGLTWLHLSDWHQKGEDFDRRVVRDALIKDIENRKKISPDLAKIDFIAFSGDIAFSGKSGEYKSAKRELFEPILNVCKLKSDRLIIVPGNHDLNRTEFKMLPPDLCSPLKNNRDVQEWLTNKRALLRVIEPFFEFKKFVSKFTGQKHPEFANILQLEMDGKEVALLGLNSAWMCGRRINSDKEIDDYGTLLIGEPQVYEALEKASSAYIKIAIFHHPFEWMAQFDRNRVESRLMNECDLILCGHQHDPDVKLLIGPLRNCAIIPAGSCYNRREPEGARYINAYNFAHFNFDTRATTVFLRRWSEKRQEWIMDTDSSNTGKYQFSIPLSLESPLISDRTNAIPNNSILSLRYPELIANLHEWKEVHHQVHQLLDRLQSIDSELMRCQIYPTQLEHGLSIAEDEWEKCTTDIRIMVENFSDLRTIRNTRPIESFLVQFDKIDKISRKIGAAKNIKETINIQRDIVDLRNGTSIILNVADNKIRKLIEALK
jgi:predicted MPP superfamily phosphohydrolase